MSTVQNDTFHSFSSNPRAAAQSVRAERAQQRSKANEALAILLDRRRLGDDTVTSTQVRDARDELEHWTELLAAADLKLRHEDRVARTQRRHLAVDADEVPVTRFTHTAAALKHAKWLVQDGIEESFELAAPVHSGPRPAFAILPNRDERLPVIAVTETPALLSDNTSKAGERRTVVEVVATARPVSWTQVKSTDIYDRLDDIAASIVGKVVPSLGRVVAADIASTSAPEKGNGLISTWQVVFTSRLPEGQSKPEPTDQPGPPRTSMLAPAPRRPRRSDPLESSSKDTEHPGALAK